MNQIQMIIQYLETLWWICIRAFNFRSVELTMHIEEINDIRLEYINYNYYRAMN